MQLEPTDKFPGNAKQKAVCDELDRTVGVAGTIWMQDSDCDKPVEVRTCTMATYLIQPDGRVEERGAGDVPKSGYPR
jgi:hypothetical protein